MRESKEARLAREQEIWGLRTQSFTQRSIASRLGITQATVCKTLQRMSRRVLSEIAEELITRKAEQVAQLEYVAEEAMGAWERSKEAAKQVQKRLVAGKQGGDDVAPKPQETLTTRVQDQDGDPRYLYTAMHALAEIRKILGLQELPLVGEGGTLIIDQRKQSVLVIDGSKENYIRGLRQWRGEGTA